MSAEEQPIARAKRRGARSGLEDFELGDGGGPLTERLVALVLAGVKTATGSLLAEWKADGAPLPEVGSRWALIDAGGREVGVVETTEIRVLRLADVDDAFARDEGEGDEDAAQWRTGHERFWARFVPDVVVDDETLVVCERFRLAERFDA